MRPSCCSCPPHLHLGQYCLGPSFVFGGPPCFGASSRLARAGMRVGQLPWLCRVGLQLWLVVTITLFGHPMATAVLLKGVFFAVSCPFRSFNRKLWWGGVLESEIGVELCCSLMCQPLVVCLFAALLHPLGTLQDMDGGRFKLGILYQCISTSSLSDS